MRFQFTNENQKDYVSSDKLYTIGDGLQHGFLTEVNRNKYDRLQIPELNDGFVEVYWYEGEQITKLKNHSDGVYVDYAGQGEIPLTFVCDIPKEGNYSVRIKLKAHDAISNAMVYLGRRRLAYIGSLETDETVEITALANVCPVIARGKDMPDEDLTLDVTLIGKNLSIQEIEYSPWDGPTMYIAGDSTVTDQCCSYPYLPWNSYAAWGQMLSYFLGDAIAVSNHAHSGLTTESFRSKGHYKIMLSRLKPRDYVLLQFGHNDQKLMELKAHEGYRQRLIKYIDEIRHKGAIPVIISPLARNSWKKSGEITCYNDLLEDYAKECELIATEKGVYYIDLHRQSMELIVSKGRDDVKKLFFPGDYTHTNDYGAYIFASMVYEGLHELKTVEFDKSYVKWQPPEQRPDLIIPRKYRNRNNPEVTDIFENMDRPEDYITRVEAMDFIIRTCKFFPTNVYNDYFEDVIGHETYAGIVECACQNGMITDDMVTDGKFYPMKKITKREFVQSLINGYSARVTISDALCEMLNHLQDMDRFLKRTEAADICRML